MLSILVVGIEVCLSSLLGRKLFHSTAHCAVTNEVETVTVEQYFLKVILSFAGPCQVICSAN